MSEPATASPSTPPPAPPSAPLSEPDATLGGLIKYGGVVVVTLLAAVFGVYEAFLAPLRWDDPSFRIPLSLVLALVGNPALAWCAYAVTGWRLAGLLPGLAWCAVFVMAASRTGEGDLVLTDANWVGTFTLFAGPIAFAVGIYITALRPPKPPSVLPPDAPPAVMPLAPTAPER